MGEEFHKFSNKNHPQDPHGEHKWMINSRYHIINLVPFLFGKRGTIEFRVHPPTLNPIKAINWLFICNAILKFANIQKSSWYTIPNILTFIIHKLLTIKFNIFNINKFGRVKKSPYLSSVKITIYKTVGCFANSLSIFSTLFFIFF